MEILTNLLTKLLSDEIAWVREVRTADGSEALFSSRAEKEDTNL